MNIIRRLKRLFPLILIAILFLFTGCSAQRPVFGFNPELTLSEAPALGKPVNVTLTFNPRKDFETYTLRIILPPDVYEVVKGDLELSRISGATPSLEVTIKSVRTTGAGEIIGQVRADSPQKTPWEDDYLFISITKDGAEVSKTQPKNDLGGYPVFDANDPSGHPEQNPPITIIPYGQEPRRPSNIPLPTPPRT